ncbi:MAG TPA: radical SAM family heme chaperone HemW [Longimicrobiales bacterium]
MAPEFLYLHVPFCVRRCSYCDFAVDVARTPPLGAWLDAIGAELAGVMEAEGAARPLRIRTLYVGGGTPSLLGAGAMAALRRRLEPYVRLGDDVEWTVEANPESFSVELAVAWREAGVNRVSLGVQTFDERVLRWMGRLHGADGAVRAAEAAAKAGIENWSLDLIFGLPARLGRDWAADVERALALDPAHVSLYGLTAEPATPLGRWVREGRERLADEETYEAEYLFAAERFTAAGFEHYEVSNFARPGRESRHNAAYWSGAAYLGLGPSAHSYLPPVRRWNLRDWAAYRSAVAEGRPPVESREAVTGAALRLERTWLALRTRAGLRREGWSPAQEAMVAGWVDRGWAEWTPGGVRLTPGGWLLLDRLTVEFDGAACAASA